MDKETESQFIDGSGKAVNAVAWRKKGDSVWNYYNSSNGNKYFTIDQTLSAENYRGTVTINTNGSSSGSDIDKMAVVQETAAVMAGELPFLTIMDGI